MIHIEVGIEGTRYKSTDPSFESICTFFSHSTDNSADTYDSGHIYGPEGSFFVVALVDRIHTSFNK